MRKVTLLSLAVVVTLGAAFPVNAQTSADRAQTPVVPSPTQSSPPSQTGGNRIFFSINIGGQAREQTFSESATFTKYNEAGAVATTHAIGGGTIFDVSAGMRVWNNLAVGIGYTSFKDDDDAGVTARVPHPILFGQPRTETVTASGLEHTENIVNLQLMWLIPYREKFELALFAGPSFFTVRQDLATVRSGDIQDPAPLIRNLTITEVKESAVGFNVGADGSYRITEMGGVSIGIGLFARFVAASLDLPAAAGATLTDDLQGGGFQGGGGLRLGF